MDTVKGKKIWVIGASSGIGAALSLALHEAGAQLILSARSADKLQALNAQIGGVHTALPLDVADQPAFVEAIKEHGPALDSILFLPAIYTPGALTSSKLEDVNRSIAINLTSAMTLAHTAEHVMKRGSHVIFCASVAGYRGLPNGQPYCATKAAIINLAESLKIDWAPKGIDVKMISPGFVRTPLTDKNAFDMPMMIEPEEAAQRIIKGITSKAFEIHFPKRFTYLVKLLNFLVYPLFFAVMKPLASKRQKGME